MPDLPAATVEELLQCAVCHDLMREPSSLTCGHSFCRTCLLRTLRHQRSCPSCRRPCHTVQNPQPNVALSALLTAAFPDRAAAAGSPQNCADDAKELPVFLSETALLPQVGLRMRFFEPRYLQLVRRAVDGGNEFLFATARGSTRRFPLDADPAEMDGTGACLVSIVDSREQIDGTWFVSCLGKDGVRLEGCKVEEGGLLTARIKKLPPEILSGESAEEAAAAAEQYERIRRALPLQAQTLPIRDGCADEAAWLWTAACALGLSSAASQQLLDAKSLAERRAVLDEAAAARAGTVVSPDVG